MQRFSRLKATAVVPSPAKPDRRSAVEEQYGSSEYDMEESVSEDEAAENEEADEGDKENVQPPTSLGGPPNMMGIVDDFSVEGYGWKTTDAGYPIFRRPARAAPAPQSIFGDPHNTIAQGISKPPIRRSSLRIKRLINPAATSSRIPMVPIAPSPAALSTQTQQFIEYWRAVYSRHEASDLRVLCADKGIVRYGRRAQIIERLVERTLRDRARGWSEIHEFVGKVTPVAPPRAPWEFTSGGEMDVDKVRDS